MHFVAPEFICQGYVGKLLVCGYYVGMNHLNKIDRRISVAPMLACTDRHYRFFSRLISKQVLLYTEMITTPALIYGDRDKLLRFSAEENPLALQLGGSNPKELAICSKMGQNYGYDEINLNVGCPSDRVQSGQFGACLMKQPQLVADCVAAMRDAVSIPVTVKTRIGVDDQDSFSELVYFIKEVANAGVDTFILHARKAWLKGLSPKDNRTIPPLKYEAVYALKRELPHLNIIINGGIQTLDQVHQHLRVVDGVMIGREAYANPWILSTFENFLSSQPVNRTVEEVLTAYLPYVERELLAGVKLRALTRFLIGLFPGQPGARAWRRALSDSARHDEGVALITQALASIQSSIAA